MKMRHINTAFFTPDTRRELASLLLDSMRVNGLDDQFIDATELATERVNANRPSTAQLDMKTPRGVKTRFSDIKEATSVLKRQMLAFGNEHYNKTLAAAAALETGHMGSARELLSRMRGDLDTLHKWCSTVVTTIEPGKSEKPSKRWALWLTTRVATAYRDLYGELPTTQRASWFPAYMDKAGQLAGVTVGRVIVAQAVEALQAQHV